MSLVDSTVSISSIEFGKEGQGIRYIWHH